jgi:UDP-4-amino-4,6-dideoxy-N-acetyl-beta-L-altrosamine transaminase
MTAALPALPYGRQTIEDDDIAAVALALRSTGLTCGLMAEGFEIAFAKSVGAAHAVVCSSGTAARHLACRGLGIGAGDAVVIPAVTFVATANAARFCGAEVVFADVDPDTGLTSAEHIEQAVARARALELRPTAVAPVHLNGQVCAVPEIALASDALGLDVVEDACHAIGSEYVSAEGDHLMVGACRHAATTVFSLHALKTLAMGEGGVVTTNDADVARRLRRLRNHSVVREPEKFEHSDLAFDSDGSVNPWYMEFDDVGYNYRASDIQCALGLNQLGKLHRFVTARRGLVGCYRERLSALAPVVSPVGRAPNSLPAWHLAVALIEFRAAGVSRGALMRRLAASGIGSQVHYVPLHLQPCFRRRYGEQRLPGAEAYYARCLSLPLFPTMSACDVDRVVDALSTCIQPQLAS